MAKPKVYIGTVPPDFGTAARKHGRAFARYVYALRYASGKRILDAGCGGGYGTAWLARAARSVLGVDNSEVRLNWARSHFTAANLEYRQHDLAEAARLPGPYDLITCFEVLEHVKDPAGCVGALAAVLADDGVALISVPNGEKEIAAEKTVHDVQFAAEEFRRMMEDRFASVRCFSQVYVKNLLHYFRKLAFLGRHDAANYRFVPGLDQGAKTWLAECRRPKRG